MNQDSRPLSQVPFLENYNKHPDKFGEWLGYKIDELVRSSGKAKVSLLIREDHLSPAQRVHGGVVSAFLDFACGAAVFSILESYDFTSTVELKVNYLKPLELGDRLVADTKVMFEGKRLCVVMGTVFRNEEQEPVALATGTYHLIRKSKKSS
jgi:uncharacterized protein (TIGR00369 family)